MSLFEAVLKIKGFPIREAKEKIKITSELNPSSFLEYQEEKKWGIFNLHFNNNPFYKEICKGRNVKDWHNVPIMKKRDLQLPISKMLNPQYKLNEVYVNKTSGSSGTPMVYAKDKFCHAMSWALILQRYEWHGIHAADKQARFYGIPLEGMAFYKEKIKDIVANRVRFVVNDLSDNVLIKFIEKFKTIKFKYIYGYTNSIKLFAQLLVRKNLTLIDICPSLKFCVVTSEVCLPDDEALLKKAFGVPVLNEYGASETGVIAFHDKDFNWRVSDEDLFVEVLDDKGNPVAENEEGRIIITSLYNKAMPIIRYEIGDIASLRVSSQKRKFLNNLQGRLNDTIRLPSGKIVPGLTLYYVSKAIMDDLAGLKEYNIKQTALDTIEYDLVAEGNIDENLIDVIKKATYSYLENGLNIKVNKVESIKRTAAGKFKHFQSFIDTPEIIQK